jgi:hypothetical protein
MQSYGKAMGMPQPPTMMQFAKKVGAENNPNPKVSGKALAKALMQNAKR